MTADALREGEPLIRIAAGEGADPRGGPARPPSLEVHAGELVLLEGGPGSGKSTVLRAAVGLLSVPHLRIRVDGHDLGNLPHSRRRRALARTRLLYLPREPVLLSNLTVLDNLLLPIRFFGERALSEAHREALEQMEAMDLGREAWRRPARLSHGDRKAVALLRGLLRRPRVALLDDPLLGLARRRAGPLGALLGRATAGGGCASLLVSRPGGRYRGLATRTVSMGDQADPEGPETLL